MKTSALGLRISGKLLQLPPDPPSPATKTGDAAEGVANAAAEASAAKHGYQVPKSPPGMVERLSGVLGVSSGGGVGGKHVKEAAGSNTVAGGKGGGSRGGVGSVGSGGGGRAGAGVGESGNLQQQEIERLRKHTVSLER